MNLWQTLLLNVADFTNFLERCYVVMNKAIFIFCNNVYAVT
jgi:hypothetical protein